MKYQQAMSALKQAGTAQNRKVYGRHGVTGDMFGVSYAVLGKLRKQIGVDQGLAARLWASGNHDARILATMVADPTAMTSKELDDWARDLRYRGIAAAYSNVVAASPHALVKMKKWRKARDEFKRACSWYVLCSLAREPDVPDSVFEESLRHIRENIHDEKNWVRYAMNQGLIGIGVRNPELTKLAIAAAREIGKVHVDHGETGCKTPDAEPYIRKTLEHRKDMAARRKAKKKSAAKTKSRTRKPSRAKSEQKPAPRRKSARKKAARKAKR